MKRLLVAVVLALVYAATVIPFAGHMKTRPTEVRLGYVPDAEILKATMGEYRCLLSELTVIKVLFYFGSLVEGSSGSLAAKPSYGSMYRNLTQAIKLDPYNQDAYYFSQAIFTWDVGRAWEVNRMLEHGMKYRTWDYMLPFWAGFNSAYFLHDYPAAARYYQRAAEISGDPLFTKLAARYFHESGREDLGVLFLDVMTKGAKDEKIKKSYALRKQALVAAKTIRTAMEEYRGRFGMLPRSMDDLVASGVISSLPKDPYGGRFFIDKNGKVATTSKFTDNEPSIKAE